MIKNGQTSVQKQVKSKPQEKNKAFKRKGEILSEYGVQCCTILTVITVNWLIGVRPLCCFIAISIAKACGQHFTNTTKIAVELPILTATRLCKF